MAEPTRAELKYLIERQREEITTVNEVGRLLSSTTDPQEIVRLVASYLRQTFPVALCGVLLLEPRKLQVIQFTKIAQVDFKGAIREICSRANERLSQQLSEEALTLTVEDQSTSGGQWVQSAIGYLRSNYSAPLLFRGHPIGLLSVFSGKAEAFTGEELHIIEIVSDQLGASLRNASLLDELQRANELKNELLMVISHELRIPLTSIKEGVSLLSEGALGAVNPEQQDFLKTVNESAGRLEMLVEKVVTATQVVTNQLRYTVQEMDVAALLREVEAMFRPLAESKGLRFELSGAGRPIPFSGDAKRLTEALAHLVENAVQATASGGGVRLACNDTGATIEIQINDTGVGIPSEEIPKLFEQFRIIGGVDNRKTGGLGLGLFIAKTVITAHRGTIHVESAIGQGTRVAIQLSRTAPGEA